MPVALSAFAVPAPNERNAPPRPIS